MTSRFAMLLVTLGTLSAGQLFAQDAQDEKAPQPQANDVLALQQSQLASKYEKLENLLSRMSEIEATNNPTRSALLRQALSQSKEQLTLTQLKSLSRWLTEETTPSKRVVDNQKAVEGNMQALLKLLLSENRPERLRDRQTQIKEYIKEVERLLRIQKSLQGRTRGGDDEIRLAKEQGKVAGRTERLVKTIKENEGEGGEESSEGEGKEGEGKEGEGKEGEGQQGEGQQGEGQQGEGQQGEGQQGEGQQGEGQQGEGQQGEGQQGEGKEGEGKEGEGKEGEGKEGEGKEGEGKEGEGKEGEGKEGEGKEGEGKEGEGKEGEGQQGEGQQGEGQQGEGQQGEGQQGEGQQGEGQQGEGQQGEGQQGEGQQGEGQQSQGQGQQSQGQGQQGEGQQGQQQQQQEQNPAQKRLQAAEERMRKAQQKLEEAKRKDAEEEQEQARRELEQAKAELEEILRQLREEEVERTLALLEGRFRQMLEMQLRVYEASITLSKVSSDRWGRREDIRAGQLAADERKIVAKANGTYSLLVEEGSSIAFPETVAQMRDDMEQVVARLAQSKVGRITTGLEEDIIRTLEELIEALQKAQEDLQQQQQQQQQQQGGQPQDQPLVDAIAELRMIRSQQLRINTRTKRYSRLLDDENDPVGQADDKDLKSAIQRLSDRQDTVQRITRDIVVGKNK